ncbi:hypothetical protein CPB85DRAFT_1334845 [Mucidula mucida]|nr:hypothetical protein CPB85DRAFT_1334845 [Mucidula mucida]
MDKSAQCAPAPMVRYINLAEHKDLAVHWLDQCETFIILQEYVEFMADAATATNPRFFLTGQPGIGKSAGAVYFLFRLLSSGQSVFFIPERHYFLYFSKAGVHIVKGDNVMDYRQIRDAIRHSWVLIDIDGPAEYFPGRWINMARGLIWTSSPMARRMHHFTKQFSAAPWYMKPWSLEEIAVMTKLNKKDPQDVLARLAITGPIARSIFGLGAPDLSELSDTSVIDGIIKNALAHWDFFNFAYEDVIYEGNEASHDIFLIQPLEVWDKSEKPSFRRKVCSFDFLSGFIANRTVELAEWHGKDVRRQLAQAFDSPTLRPAAGKLVENMIHRAFMYKKIGVPAAFGGGPVKAELELIGDAQDFLLETHVLDQCESRPLYLRPHSGDFAVVNAILITKSVLCPISSSLTTWNVHVVKSLLQILARLATNNLDIDSLNLVYCFVGTDEDCVKKVVRDVNINLLAIRARPHTLEVAQLSPVDLTRLSKLEVEGFMLDTEKGLIPT